MAYCGLEDILKSLPKTELLDLNDDTATGQINDAVVSEAIAQADGVIDTYLGARYAVPLSSVPPIIRKCSVDLAIAALYKRKVADLPDTPRGREKDAMRILEAIRDGRMSLPVAVSGESSGFAMGLVSTSHFEDTNA